METKLIFPLMAACILSFSGAVFAFNAGWGLLIAFAIYALGGSAMMILFMALAFVPDMMRTERRAEGQMAWVGNERRRSVQGRARIIANSSFPVA